MSNAHVDFLVLVFEFAYELPFLIFKLQILLIITINDHLCELLLDVKTLIVAHKPYIGVKRALQLDSVLYCCACFDGALDAILTSSYSAIADVNPIFVYPFSAKWHAMTDGLDIEFCRMQFEVHFPKYVFRFFAYL